VPAASFSGVVHRVHPLGAPRVAVLGPVGDRHLQRAEHAQAARRPLVQVVADRVLEQAVVVGGVELGRPDPVAEVPDALRGVAPPAHARDGRHPRVVPALDMPVVDELLELALAGDDVGRVQARELGLLRVVDRLVAGLPRLAPPVDRVDEPVVQRAVVLELERADRVGDPLDRVLQPVRPVVHRVDVPVAARPVVGRVDDPVHHRVAHVHVGARHVDFGAQHLAPVRELAVLHPLEQVEALLDGPVAEGRVGPGPRRVAPHLPDLLGGLLVDIRQALADQVHRPLVEPLEVVAREADGALPPRAHPLDIPHDRVDEDLLFLLRVRVVEPEEEGPAVLRRQPVVERDALRVPQVQEPVGLGGEPRPHDRPVARRRPTAPGRCACR
jgi:hypothetical protein